MTEIIWIIAFAVVISLAITAVGYLIVRKRRPVETTSVDVWADEELKSITVETDDPILAMVIAEAYFSGDVVTWSDDEGIKHHPKPPDDPE